MSVSGKQNPLGVNTLSSVLYNTGLTINPSVPKYAGTSHLYTAYSPGSIVSDTCLRLLTYAINDGYTRGVVDDTTYDNLISIGAGTIPALGNSKAPTYTFTGPANTGDPTSEPAQALSWNPYDHTNDVTQWGYIRLVPLQAWNEFNWNGSPSNSTVQYKDFCNSFQTAYGFIEYTNASIFSIANGDSFLKGTYSNMNDLMSADITGVNLATKEFGQDLIASGRAIDTATLSTFGMPSNLLATLRKNNGITQSVSLALIAAGLNPNELTKITATNPATTEQEQNIYSAFLLITGVDLVDVLIALNCKTEGIINLADLLNPLKLFPNSYKSLTVPVYNSQLGLPTNSKTYYPIYGEGSVSSTLTNPAIVAQVGAQVPPSTPAINPSATIVSTPPASNSRRGQSGLFKGDDDTALIVDSYNKIKTAATSSGYVPDESTGKLLTADEAAYNTLSQEQRKEITNAYAQAVSADVSDVTNSPKESFNMLSWAKQNRMLR